jgi:hypothetical protein
VFSLDVSLGVFSRCFLSMFLSMFSLGVSLSMLSVFYSLFKHARHRAFHHRHQPHRLSNRPHRPGLDRHGHQRGHRGQCIGGQSLRSSHSSPDVGQHVAQPGVQSQCDDDSFFHRGGHVFRRRQSLHPRRLRQPLFGGRRCVFMMLVVVLVFVVSLSVPITTRTDRLGSTVLH